MMTKLWTLSLLVLAVNNVVSQPHTVNERPELVSREPQHFKVNLPQWQKRGSHSQSHDSLHAHSHHHKQDSELGQTEARMHSCIHDYIEHDKQVSPQSYNSHPIDAKRKLAKLREQMGNDQFDSVDQQMEEQRRRLAVLSPSDYQPIRITPYWDALEASVTDDALLEYIQQLVSSAIHFFEASINVIPIADVLYVSPYCAQGWYINGGAYFNCYEPSFADRVCGHVTVPDEHLGTAWSYDGYSPYQAEAYTVNSGGQGTGLAESDLVIYVSANDSSCGGSTLAWATSCDVDQYGRPIAGTINFCQSALESGVWKEDIDITVHELTHVLAMSSSLFDYFVDPDTGGTLDQEDIYTTQHDGATNFTYIVTDRVKALAHAHYGCDSLVGQPLEDDGSAGTVGSHWEEYHTDFEIMVGTIYSTDMKVSYFTFALMEDSGWYTVNYNYTEPYWWGYNQSCSFWNGTCIIDEEAAFTQFCDTSTEDEFGCSVDHEQTAGCLITDYGTDLDFQWFSDGSVGGTENAQFCPIWDGYHVRGSFVGYCYDSRGNNESFWYDSDLGNYPIEYSMSARCIVSDVSATSSSYSQLGLCFELDCFGYDGGHVTDLGGVFVKETGQWGGVTIRVGDEQVNCSRSEAGASKAVPNYGFTVQCPSVDSVCYGEEPFECQYGYWNNELSRCVCSPGYDGDNCEGQLDADAGNIVDSVSLYQGTTEAPADDDKLCVRGSAFTSDGDDVFNGQWGSDGVYGIYMSYKKSGYYLWFDTWNHLWAVSETKGLDSSQNFQDLVGGCDLERFKVPDITDCNGGDWYFTNGSSYVNDIGFNVTVSKCSSGAGGADTTEPGSGSAATGRYYVGAGMRNGWLVLMGVMLMCLVF